MWIGAASVGAQGCSPQAGPQGEVIDARQGGVSAQAADGIKQESVIDGSGRYPLNLAPGAWIEQTKLVPEDGAPSDFLGSSVSISGDTALLGSWGDDDAGTNWGSAYVFVRSATTWTQQQELFASDGATNDRFGHRVSISGDTALVGAWDDDDASGSAYVFGRSATSWTQQDKLLAPDRALDDRFGYSVSVSGDTALVGADLDDDAGTNSGSAYVFVRSATSWTYQDKLLAGDGAANDNFGSRVSLSGDTALMGATGDGDAGSSSGAAYVFVRSATSWTQQDKLLASDGAANDIFGYSVSMVADAALVGAAGDDDAGSNSGSAYIFVRSATSWTQQDKLIAGDGAADDIFGFSVSLSDDTALVGARSDADAGLQSGSAYVFARSAASWTQQDKLLASDGAANDQFGLSVSLSGGTAILGAHHDNAAGNYSGSAYVFGLRFAEGQPCATNRACSSDFCVDGVCCESACGGSCETCNVAGFEGVCTPADRGSAPAPSCSGHLCNGAAGDCPTDCAGDQDCTSAFYCPSTRSCTPKEVTGTLCGGNNVCLSGQCVDRVCCEDACDDGCGSCVVAGLEGACTPFERGHPGTPNCTPYLCGGQDAACPSSCQAHADCADDSHCSDGLCQLDGDQGSACSEDGACTTGYCTDGVCCLADACGAYRCGPGGTCHPVCSSSAQCAPGHHCSSERTCEPGGAGANDANDSGSCHLASVSRGQPQRWRLFGGFAMLACLGLARRRAVSRRPPCSDVRFRLP